MPKILPLYPSQVSIVPSKDDWQVGRILDMRLGLHERGMFLNVLSFFGGGR